jgi:hypothetical protein
MDPVGDRRVIGDDHQLETRMRRHAASHVIVLHDAEDGDSKRF